MNKKLIAILTLVMFAVTLLPMGAFAATTNVGLHDALVGTGQFEKMGNLRIAETEATIGSMTNGATITITPLNGAKFEFAAGGNNVAVNAIIPAASIANMTGVTAVAAADATADSITLTLNTPDPTKASSFIVDFMATNVTLVAGAITSGVAIDTRDMTGDEVVLNIQGSANSGVTNGNVVVARKASKGTETSVLSQKDFVLGKSNQDVGTIRVNEKAKGSIGTNIDISTTTTDVVIVDVAYTTNVVAPGLTATGYVGADYTLKNTDGYSMMSVPLTGASTSAGFIDISGIKLLVKEGASVGDITLKISGNGDFTTQTIVVGTVKDIGYTLSVKEEKTFYAGEERPEIANFFVKENAEGSIVGNSRTLRVTLPANTAWETVPTVSLDKGDLAMVPTFTGLENDRRTAVYTFGATGFSSSATTLKFAGGRVAVKANAAAGDLELTFAGSSNIAGELKVATIAKPVTAEASSADIQIGKNAQPVGDILIKEAKAGYIKAATDYNTLIVRLPENVKASAVPTVEVVEGNLKIDKVERGGTANRDVIITIKNASSVASTIKVSNLKVDVDRTLAEGPYNFTITGSALNRVFARTLVAGAPAVATDVVNALDAKASDAVQSFQGMIIVTPAQEGVVKAVTMTVGSTVYTIDGVENDMDVAPYIKSDRTYFPVRYVANALGINDENVVWDPAQRTVTIFRANRIVQVAIGSTTMLVNGVPVTMDVAPEITAERTMLPIRFVAQGLGVNVVWDAATQTVTLN